MVFSARTASESALEKRAEAAMAKALGRTFYTIARPVDAARTPVFMSLIAKHFGPDVTTRTWDTVKRCALAGARNQGAP